jgi:hypothetical protein
MAAHMLAYSDLLQRLGNPGFDLLDKSICYARHNGWHARTPVTGRLVGIPLIEPPDRRSVCG